MRLTSHWRPRRCAIALVAGLGCGPAVSLDDPTPTGGSGTSTGAGPFGLLTSSGDDAASLGSLDEGPLLDLPVFDLGSDVPPPPDGCEPACELELALSWAYDGPAGPLPLDPEDRVALVVDPFGGVVVAEERQGALALARLSSRGQELWTLPLALPCDPCRLVELGLHPSGDLLLAGRGVDATGTPIALAARVELGGPQVVWATGTTLALGSGVAPRAGSLVVHDANLLYQPAIEGSGTDGMEQLVLLAYDAATGDLLSADVIASGHATGDAAPPLAAYDAVHFLVVTHPAWSDAAQDLAGSVSWLATPSLELLATGTRLTPSRGLTTDPFGRAITLGQSLVFDQSVLHVGCGGTVDPNEWEIAHVLPTVTSSTAALAVGGVGRPHVAARTAFGPRPGHEALVELAVLSWTTEGRPAWGTSLPVSLDHVDEPVALAVPLEGVLVLGGFVAGARHVEQRVVACNCG